MNRLNFLLKYSGKDSVASCTYPQKFEEKKKQFMFN